MQTIYAPIFEVNLRLRECTESNSSEDSKESFHECADQYSEKYVLCEDAKESENADYYYDSCNFSEELQKTKETNKPLYSLEYILSGRTKNYWKWNEMS